MIIIATKTNTTKRTTSRAQEMRDWYEKHHRSIENFEAAQSALQLLDYTKSTTSRSYSSRTKENFRTYMQNPLTNYQNLRELSRLLYYRCLQYRRLIWYNAEMIDTTARSIIPLVDITQPVDEAAMTQSYYDTALVLENMNLPLEMLKAYVTAFREDVFFGCAYYDEGGGYFILPLNPDYCKIAGVYYTGDFSFVMDMSYFRSNQDLLEYWGEPFTTMYRAYESDMTNGRYQYMPDEYCVCFKVNIDDYEIPLPPFMGLFNSLINLIDLEDIQAIADEQQIYKLLVAEIPTIEGSTTVDDFAVDPRTANGYFNKILDSLPSYSDAVISPIPLNVIDFTDDQATDTTKVETATQTLFNTSGGAQILQAASTSSSSTAWEGATLADQEYALSSLLPQTEAYLNRFISYHVSNPAKIKLHEVTTYTKAAFKERVLKDAQYGIPTKLLINTLNGFTELETISMSHLESALGLKDLFVPLSSSYTQSSSSTGEDGRIPADQGSDGGRPENTADQGLTDEGDATKTADKNA